MPTSDVTAALAAAFLASRFGDEAGPPRPFAHGEWSKAYAFRRAGADYVIRFSALEEDFRKDALAARYASPHLPIPRVLEIGEAYGGFYCVSERAPGTHIDAVDGDHMRRLLPSLFAMLDAARLVDLSQTSGYGGFDAAGNAPDPTWRANLLQIGSESASGRSRGWRELLAGSPIGTAPFEAGLKRLQTLVERCPEQRSLVHGDLLHFNVLVEDDRITGVVDWGCGIYGDFLYDVAWFAYYAPWYPAWRGIDFVAEAARHYQAIGLHVPHYEDRLRCYQLRIGLDDLKWNAGTQNWPQFAATADRLAELVSGND